MPTTDKGPSRRRGDAGRVPHGEEGRHSSGEFGRNSGTGDARPSSGELGQERPAEGPKRAGVAGLPAVRRLRGWDWSGLEVALVVGVFLLGIAVLLIAVLLPGDSGTSTDAGSVRRVLPTASSVSSQEVSPTTTPEPAFDPGRFVVIGKDVVGRWEVVEQREQGRLGNIFLNNVYVKTLELSADGRYCVVVRDGAGECGRYTFIGPTQVRFEAPPPTGTETYDISYSANEMTLSIPKRLAVKLQRIAQ